MTMSSQKIVSERLPLAVYREVAAHLRQVEGVEAGLILRPTEHDSEAKFDYFQSQVAALEIKYAEDCSAENRERVDSILDYYGQRYAPWEIN